MPETDAPKPKRGAPELPFDQEIADYICDRIASETVSMKTICSEEGLPSHTTIFKWLARNADFAAQYSRAKEAQQHAMIDDTIDIADDGSNDWVKRLNHNGGEPGWEVNGEAIARSRLRIDQRKWAAAHLAPKTYGEKLAIDQKTTMDVTDPVKALLEQVATNGTRLMPKIDEQS